MSQVPRSPTQPQRLTAAERRAARTMQARAARRRRLFRNLLVGAVIVISLALLASFYFQRRTTLTAGVQSFANLSRNHVPGKVAYPQTPPVGGDHNTAWQNCGYYDTPVANENAVHSLEHGAVWITYQPNLPGPQIAILRGLARGQSHVLVVPFPGLPTSVVASAWGKQLQLDSADDPRLKQFRDDYQQGSQTPEPGAVCSGGVGAPK